MQPKRLSVKFFLTDPSSVDPEKVVPVFQRWIQHQMVEGMLIDVADYKHVIDGPGVLLIADEGDYALNLNDGRPGLMYLRKRQMPDTLTESLRSVFRPALMACQKFSQERVLGHPKIDTSEAEITFVDRLRTPNTPETYAALSEEIEASISSLYAGQPIALEPAHADPRECLSVRVKADGDVDLDTLLQRLGAGETVNP